MPDAQFSAMTKESAGRLSTFRAPVVRTAPGSCYRLQLNASFTFDQALEVTDYLRELGITDCYASPIFAARPHSTHGYDVCDWGRINSNIGSQQAFERWAARLRELGMGLVLDIVPNHMGADLSNPWWRDVLRYGESSKFASWFDIDWKSTDSNTRGKVLLPVLEEPYWKVLEGGKLRVVFQDESLVLLYHQSVFPLSPQSLANLQQELLRMCREEARLTESFEDLNDLGEIAAKLVSLTGTPGGGEGTASPDKQARRAGAEAWPILERALQRFNGRAGAAESFNALHDLIQQQHYRLAHWQIGNAELNYRRFFDVTELVALRMELPAVFQATHELVLRFVREGKVTGLRVDHPDGLWDPRQYFERLQQACRDGLPDSLERRPDLDRETAPLSLRQAAALPLFILAEKILTGDEELPPDWPVAGTTGYEFLNLSNGLFVDPASCRAMDDLYSEFTGTEHPFKSLVYAAKVEILQTSMRADLRSLSRMLHSIAAASRYGFDFTLPQLEKTLAAIVAAFPVYRTYLTEQAVQPLPAERAQIEEAVRIARQVNPDLTDDVLRFVQSLLLLSPPEDLAPSDLQACRDFVMKFQQLTGPVMAKGLEDTAFYRFNRLLSLNEVGGAPDRFGTELESFHEHNALRALHWPYNLLTTATHDTKRGEDLRARLNVLSEIPEEWRQAVLKWSRVNAAKKTRVDGAPAPDANDEYLLYQTLVGAWVSEAENGTGTEAFQQRIAQYMLKATREAKVHTSWTNPNSAYEKATERFLQEILTHSQENLFLDDFMLFQRKVAFFGLFNSLAQVVLKTTAPGIPDFYQGTELWDYSLVDPDNRKPVDYRPRRELLSDLREKLSCDHGDVSALVKLLVKNYQSGQIKLYMIWRVLELRRRRRVLFERGSYRPLAAQGSKRVHVCAYAREDSGARVITVVARLLLSLTKGSQRGALEPEVWLDTTLPVPGGRPGDRYRDAFTQQIFTLRSESAELPIRDILPLLPVAVLERID